MDADNALFVALVNSTLVVSVHGMLSIVKRVLAQLMSAYRRLSIISDTACRQALVPRDCHCVC